MSKFMELSCVLASTQACMLLRVACFVMGGRRRHSAKLFRPSMCGVRAHAPYINYGADTRARASGSSSVHFC